MWCLGFTGSIIVAITRYRRDGTMKSLMWGCIGCILMMICLAYVGATDVKH